MAVRVRSRWHAGGRSRSQGERASVVAALGWRIAQASIGRMRERGYDIDCGPQYFHFVCELLVFLDHVADRIAFELLDEAQRGEFTSALVVRSAEVVEDNRDMLLGLAVVGASRRHVIDLFNERAAEYSEYGYDREGGPDFAMRRAFGAHIRQILPEKDRAWVMDQVMEIEVPEAVAAVEKSTRGLLAPASEAPRTHPREGEAQ